MRDFLFDVLQLVVVLAFCAMAGLYAAQIATNGL